MRVRGNGGNAFDKGKGCVLCCYQRDGSVGISASSMHESQPGDDPLVPVRYVNSEQVIVVFPLATCVCGTHCTFSSTTQLHFRGYMMPKHTVGFCDEVMQTIPPGSCAAVCAAPCKLIWQHARSWQCGEQCAADIQKGGAPSSHYGLAASKSA
jgi:hypothetical protein